jgi:hypothetical protein
MRQITVTAPHGRAREVAEVAFGVGISEVSIAEKRVLSASGCEVTKDSIEMEVGTPLAKAFMDEFTSKPFFTREEFSIAVRQPRAIISHERLNTLTRPLVEPSVDIFEELWQFSQVTYGFVGRILIGGLLLSYGLVEYQLLLIIAGLLFIPLLPLILSIGFGLWTKQWRLAGQGLFSLAIALLLLILAGVSVGLLTNPPVRYSEFNSLGIGLLISCAVGVAAGLATVDDVGRREMIGLAATAQIAIIPAWLGLCFVMGFPGTDAVPLWRRLVGLLLNILAITGTSFFTYALVGIKGSALCCFKAHSVTELTLAAATLQEGSETISSGVSGQ